MSANTLVSESVLDTLHKHVSIRRYTDTPISDSLLLAVLNAARRAPTSSNVQAYAFVVVRNPETKQKLAALAGNQKHVEQCPVFVAVCADITRLRQACVMQGVTLAQNTENTLVATIDAALAGMSLATAAESLGMGTVMIGGTRNHPEKVGELLGLPDGVFVVFGMCLGFYEEDHKPAQKPRLPENAIIHFEQYQPAGTSLLEAHDAELAAHYRSEGRDSPDDAWTGVIAEKFSHLQRPHLREILEKMGFSFK